MNKIVIILLSIICLTAGCKPNVSDKKDASDDKKAKVMAPFLEDDIKKFIRSYPVIIWKIEDLKKDISNQNTENNKNKINDFAKELGYTSIDEFMRAWMVLATIQVKLDYKKEIEIELRKKGTSKERKEIIKIEIKIVDEYLKYGFVREDLPLADVGLMNKYYEKLADLKITDLFNG